MLNLEKLVLLLVNSLTKKLKRFVLLKLLRKNASVQ